MNFKVPWVLLLGIYPIFYYFPGLILFPKLIFNLDRNAIAQDLIEPRPVAPQPPLKRLISTLMALFQARE